MVFITIVSFVIPKPVAAFGGELLKPIVSFVVGLADGMMWIIQKIIGGQDMSFIEISMGTDWASKIFGVVMIILGAAAFIVGGFITGGALATILVSALQVLGSVLGTIGLVSFSYNDNKALKPTDITVTVSGYEAEAYGGNTGKLVLPLFAITPEEIFKGEIPLFDVNFFNPNTERWLSPYAWLNESKEYTYTHMRKVSLNFNEEEGIYVLTDGEGQAKGDITVNFEIYYGYKKATDAKDNNGQTVNDAYYFSKKIVYNSVDAGTKTETFNTESDHLDTNTIPEQYKDLTANRGPGGNLQWFRASEWAGGDEEKFTNSWFLNDYIDNEIVDEITKNRFNASSTHLIYSSYGDDLIPLYIGDIEYIAGKRAIQAYPVETDESVGSITSIIAEIVSTWYYSLLILATVAMLSILVYTGIRILISSAAADKAKYKQRLGDWFVGMILLFTLHYIMVFANLFVDNLTNVIGTMKQDLNWVFIEDTEGNIEKTLHEKLGYTLVDIDTNLTGDYIEQNSDPSVVYRTRLDSEGNYYYLWQTNLMGRLRIDLQAYTDDAWNFIGYAIMYIMMIIFLFMFVVVYLKRVIYMAFLTLIAPLVAATYAIDKMNDGSAQGFNFWFKEYMFNLLLQPMHLLLYTILVSSAIKLAQQNPLYAIVALGFMVPAEKILRRMFNFGKAETPGVFGGVAGATMVMSGLRWLTGHGPHGGKGKGPDADKPATDASGNKILSTGRSPLHLASGLSRGSSSAGRNSPTRGSTDEGSTDGGSTDGGSTPDVGSDTDVGNSSGDGSINSGGGTYGASYSPGANAALFAMSNLMNTDNSTDTNKNNKRRRIRTALGNAVGTYTSGMKKKFIRKLNNVNPLRMMAGLAGSAALATVGVAAGAASGDFSKAAQYGGIAALGGYKLGSGTAGAVGSALSVDGTVDSAKRGFYGEEDYQYEMAKRNQKLAMQDEENIKKVQEKLKLSRKEAQERLKDMIPFYYDNKVSDMDEIMKMEKTVKNEFAGDPTGREKAFLGAQFYKQYGLNSQLEDKKRQERLQRALKDYQGMMSDNMIRTAFNDWAGKYANTVEGL